MQWFVQLNAASGKVTPILIENEGLAFPTVGLEDCVIYTPEGAQSRMTGVPARLSAAKLFDRDEEFVVVTGRKRFHDTEDVGYGQGGHRVLRRGVAGVHADPKRAGGRRCSAATCGELAGWGAAKSPHVGWVEPARGRR